MRGYTLGEVLGEGAFGTVYRSTQPGVDREVAIKVIRADLADDPTFVRRFEAEAQLVAHLEHPHIVPLYDFWREPGGAYLVFRLLRGGSGAGVCSSATDRGSSTGSTGWSPRSVGRSSWPMPPASCTATSSQPTCSSTTWATPIWPTSGSRPSTTSPSRLSHRTHGPSAGSPLYSAPEQSEGGAPTAQSDQYSFAATVWELLTGVPPFDGDTASTILRAKLQQPVRPLRVHRPDVPREIDAVLQRATARRPDERYEDMPAMLAAWRAAMRAGTVTTDELGKVTRSAGARRDVSATAAPLPDLVANPYKGLRAFGEADARHFHGREALADLA